MTTSTSTSGQQTLSDLINQATSGGFTFVNPQMPSYASMFRPPTLMDLVTSGTAPHAQAKIVYTGTGAPPASGGAGGTGGGTGGGSTGGTGGSTGGTGGSTGGGNVPPPVGSGSGGPIGGLFGGGGLPGNLGGGTLTGGGGLFGGGFNLGGSLGGLLGGMGAQPSANGPGSDIGQVQGQTDPHGFDWQNLLQTAGSLAAGQLFPGGGTIFSALAAAFPGLMQSAAGQQNYTQSGSQHGWLWDALHAGTLLGQAGANAVSNGFGGTPAVDPGSAGKTGTGIPSGTGNITDLNVMDPPTGASPSIAPFNVPSGGGGLFSGGNANLYANSGYFPSNNGLTASDLAITPSMAAILGGSAFPSAGNGIIGAYNGTLFGGSPPDGRPKNVL